MSDHPNRKKKDSLQSSEEIHVPPIRKQTAGAVTGAAIGGVAGPIGAVVAESLALLREVQPAESRSRRLLDALHQLRKAHCGNIRAKSPARRREKRRRLHAAKLRRQDLSGRLQHNRASERHAARARGASAVAVARKGVRKSARVTTSLAGLKFW